MTVDTLAVPGQRQAGAHAVYLAIQRPQAGGHEPEESAGILQKLDDHTLVRLEAGDPVRYGAELIEEIVIADLLVLVHGALTVAGPPTAGNAEKWIRRRRTASRRRGGNLHGA